MSEYSLEDLRLSIEGARATIVIDRLAKKNAMSPELHAAMHEALDHIAAAGEVKVAVLTGVEDVFCGGMDLERYFLDAYGEPDRFRANLASSHGWMRRWEDLDAVTVAAVNGLCVGGGLLMAAISDIVIAADEASFSLSEVNFGIFPAGGTTWAVARNLPTKQALYYMLTAERFDGRRAVELGLATRSVPRARLDADVAVLVDTLAGKDRDALRYTKKVYERVRHMSYADAQQFEVAMLFDLSYQTQDAWINRALDGFRRRAYRPALESYQAPPTKQPRRVEIMSDSTQTASWDTIVIGGGPAGSTVASSLARDGRRVTVLERSETFPRHKIGESIVPYTYRMAEYIGALDKLCEAGFQIKQGFNFISKSGKVAKPYFFRQSIDDPKAITWSVEREIFDQVLLDHAADQGAVVTRGARVDRILREGQRVVGVELIDREGARHEARAPIVVDASGRAALIGRELGLRTRDPKLDQLAVWRYIEGAHKQPGDSAGTIVIALLAPRGWFWWIPLANDVTSVGVVSSARHLRSIGSTPRAQFDRALELNKTLVEWAKPGTWTSDYYVTGDYSYTCSRKRGDGWLSVGDAGGFIDPVFSPGVFLAMSSAVLAGRAIEAALQHGDSSAAAFEDYEKLITRGESTFRLFLDAFYDDNFSAGGFFKEHAEWIPEWGRVLQGDVYGDNRAFNQFIIDYRRELAARAGTEADIYIPPGWHEDHVASNCQRVPDPFELRTSWRGR